MDKSRNILLLFGNDSKCTAIFEGVNQRSIFDFCEIFGNDVWNVKKIISAVVDNLVIAFGIYFYTDTSIFLTDKTESISRKVTVFTNAFYWKEAWYICRSESYRQKVIIVFLSAINLAVKSIHRVKEIIDLRICCRQ